LGKPHFRSSRLSAQTVIVLGLFALIVLLRVWRLDADPPTTLSSSADVYTDPPQYTLFAKQFVQYGEFNPFHDNRLVFFLKSSVTALATLVFELLGTGAVQSHLVGLFYSLGGLFLFFLFLRRTAGNTAGIFYLLLICLNYNQLFYGRLPFLEHAMWFFAAAALVMVTHFRGRWAFLAAGASLAVAIFFGKVIGVVFLFPFACLLFYQAMFENRSSRSRRVARPLMFVAGFAVVALFWVWFSYLPMQQEVTGYIGEKAFTLYGAPEGWESFDDFVWKLVSFGIESELFPRMTVLSILGAVYLGFVLFAVGRGRFRPGDATAFNGGHLFIGAMIVAFYGALMPWNYQPLRYEMVLIYPLCGGAAVVLAWLWRGARAPAEDNRVPKLWPILMYPVALVVVSQAWSGLAERLGSGFAFDEVKYQAAAIALVVVAAVFAVTIVVRRSQLRLPPFVGRVIAVAALAATIGQGVALASDWFRWPAYSERDNAADLAMILAPNAVLSGPFAAQMTQSNRLGCVIHMFGVVEVDSALFKRFPITHLLVDQANEDRARKDYPYVMAGAVHICTYHVGLRKVRLYRIAGYTGNASADAYQRSPFELAVDQSHGGNSALMQQHLITFFQSHPDNISGYLLAGQMAQQTGQYAEAEQFFKKAVEFSPTNYNLIGTLAMLYKNRYAVTGDKQYKEEALRQFELALKFAPTSTRMQKAYAELGGELLGD